MPPTGPQVLGLPLPRPCVIWVKSVNGKFAKFTKVFKKKWIDVNISTCIATPNGWVGCISFWRCLCGVSYWQQDVTESGFGYSAAILQKIAFIMGEI